MEGLHFDDFTLLSQTDSSVSNSVDQLRAASSSYICSAHLLIFVYVCWGQTQAEAHYKGHKHARKLKALEAQRNRQKQGYSSSAPGRDKDKDQDVAMPGEGSASSDSHLKDATGRAVFKAKPSATSKELVISHRSTKAW